MKHFSTFSFPTPFLCVTTYCGNLIITKKKSVYRRQIFIWDSSSLRTADVFPVVASLPPKINVCEPEQQNDFRDVKPFVLKLANQIKG